MMFNIIFGFMDIHFTNIKGMKLASEVIRQGSRPRTNPIQRMILQE